MMKTLKIAGGVIIGAGLLGSCVDSNYDIVDADISKDIAIFDNGISLPVGDVDTMKIGELLDLDDSEMIEEDASSGEYCLVRTGTTEASFDIRVDESSISTEATDVNRTVYQANNPFAGSDVQFPTQNPSTGEMLESMTLEVRNEDGGTVEDNFKISSDDMPAEVLNLKEVRIDRRALNVSIRVENMGDVTDRILLDDMFLVEIPEGIITDDPNIVIRNGVKMLDLSGRTIDLESDNNGYMTYEMSIDGWYVGDEGVDIIDGRLELADNFAIDGSVHITHLFATAPANIEMPLVMTIDDFSSNLTRATGKFDPQIDPINELVEIDKSDLPDFLRREDICIDAAHASVEISMIGDIPMDIFLNGVFNSNQQSQTFGSASIDNILVSQDDRHLLLSDNGIQKDGYKSITVPGLNSLLRYIPDDIDMTMNAAADKDNYYEIEINKDNNVNIDYIFRAPLQFGNEMHIIYNDTINGWHGDLDGINSTMTALQGTMVYDTPVDVSITATAIDEQGDPINGLEVNVLPEKIIRGENDLRITITDPTGKVIGERLDGIILTLTMTNENGNQETLKADDHVILKDLALKLPEGIILNGDTLF